MKGLYIGLDLGRKECRYEVQTDRGDKRERGGTAAFPETLREILKRYQQARVPVQVAFEAGPQMYWIDRLVKELGMDSYPFHAADFSDRRKRRNKTDKKDAERIARAAAKEGLPDRVYIPGEEERRIREKITEREAYKKGIVQKGNRLRGYAASAGLPLDAKPLRAIREWEKALRVFEGSEYEAAAKRLYRTVLADFQALEEVEEEIQALVGEGEMGRARKRLETIPGIGYWTATALLGWCGAKAWRFKKSRCASAYFGLVAKKYQSGTIDHSGHITKEGPTVVRKLLIQAAWAFMRSEAGNKSRWGEWSRRRNGRSKDLRKKTTVGLARRLLTAAVACLRDETEWDPRVLEAGA